MLSERAITRNGVARRKPCHRGFRMVDRDEADDKIIAVLESDPYWAHVKELKDVSDVILKRLEHYFLTYKFTPGQTTEAVVTIEEVYGLATAKKVVNAAIEDYKNRFGTKT